MLPSSALSSVSDTPSMTSVTVVVALCLAKPATATIESLAMRLSAA
jgi:hypothetical protein